MVRSLDFQSSGPGFKVLPRLTASWICLSVILSLILSHTCKVIVNLLPPASWAFNPVVLYVFFVLCASNFFHFSIREAFYIIFIYLNSSVLPCCYFYSPCFEAYRLTKLFLLWLPKIHFHESSTCTLTFCHVIHSINRVTKCPTLPLDKDFLIEFKQHFCMVMHFLSWVLNPHLLDIQVTFPLWIVKLHIFVYWNIVFSHKLPYIKPYIEFTEEMFWTGPLCPKQGRSLLCESFLNSFNQS